MPMTALCAETMRLIADGTRTVDDIVTRTRAKVGNNPARMFTLIGELASEAKRLYLDSPDAEAAADEPQRQANAALDVVIALCGGRAT
jgi:hypothetical protein